MLSHSSRFELFLVRKQVYIRKVAKLTSKSYQEPIEGSGVKLLLSHLSETDHFFYMQRKQKERILPLMFVTTRLHNTCAVQTSALEIVTPFSHIHRFVVRVSLGAFEVRV